MSFWQRLFRRPSAPDPSAVTFDDIGVTRTLPNGQAEAVTWAALREVTILTTASGPFEDDVLWVLSGDGSGCLVPSLTPGMEALLPRLQELPGFDNEAVIQAMGSTEGAQFVCWRRDPAGPA